MFTALHALAQKQKATLMIVVSVDGDQLRISVTPTNSDEDGEERPLRPLSLVATPEELDSGFIEALTVWQSPKKSLIEQAQAAQGEASDEESTASEKAEPSTPKATAAKPQAAKKAKPVKAKSTNKAANSKPAATAQNWPFPQASSPVASETQEEGDKEDSPPSDATADSPEPAVPDSAPASAPTEPAPAAATDFELELF